MMACRSGGIRFDDASRMASSFSFNGISCAPVMLGCRLSSSLRTGSHVERNSAG
jgi:hypothetical protein